MILNHAGGLLGIPPHDHNRQEVFAIWRANIREVAQFPNVSVKLGGLAMLYCGWDFHLRDIAPGSEELAIAWRPYIEACIEAFGPGRCMMESNFPGGQAVLRLRGVVERNETDHPGLFRVGEGGAVPRHSRPGVSA